MSCVIELHPEAIKELQDSYSWYEERSEGLGKRFITFVDKQLNNIAEHPERFPKKKGNYREASVDVFPYVIIYELFKKERKVFVSYIFHTRRNPKLKFKR